MTDPRDSNRQAAAARGSTPYEIVIEGHLTPQRLPQFENLRVTHRASGETVIVGPFPDQSALLGLLNWLHNLGVVLISVRQLDDRDGRLA
jgi:hypothetical protein